MQRKPLGWSGALLGVGRGGLERVADEQNCATLLSVLLLVILRCRMRRVFNHIDAEQNNNARANSFSSVVIQQQCTVSICSLFLLNSALTVPPSNKLSHPQLPQIPSHPPHVLHSKTTHLTQQSIRTLSRLSRAYFTNSCDFCCAAVPYKLFRYY